MLKGNIKSATFKTDDELSTALAKYKKLFTKDKTGKYVIVNDPKIDDPKIGVNYYYLMVTNDNSSLDVSR